MPPQHQYTSAEVEHCQGHSTPVSRTGIFHVLFALNFFSTYDLYPFRSYLINTTTLVSYHFACSLCSTDKQKHVYSDPRRSQHNIYTTTDDPFQSKPKHKLYSIGVKPPARPSTTTPPPGSENPPYRSSRSSPRRHPLAYLLELKVPNGTRVDH